MDLCFFALLKTGRYAGIFYYQYFCLIFGQHPVQGHAILVEGTVAKER